MKISIKIVYSVVLAVVMTSCKNMEYARNNAEVEEKLFRTDALPKDSTTIATKPWREFFTDRDLQSHISKTLENNLDIRMALQNILSAEAYAKQSKNEFLPIVTLGANYTHQVASINTQPMLAGQRYSNRYDITGNLVWDLDVWGKTNAQKKAAITGYLSSVAGHQAVKSDLIKSVALNYYFLLSLDKQKEILEKTIKLRRDYVETTKALKEAGMLTEVAVQQSKALAINAEASMVTIDNQIVLSENILNMLMGEPSQRVRRSNFSSQMLPKELSLGYPIQLLSNRSDVIMAEYELIRNFELTKAAKASFYPSLRLTASGGIQSLDIDDLFSANSLFANIIGGLTQPLFNKRQIKTQYEISLINKEKAYLNFRKTLLNAGKEVSDALATYQTQDQFIVLKRKEYEAYRKSADYSTELLNNGMANYLEVLNASANSLNAELNILNAEYVQMKSLTDLYAALGGGWRE